MDDFIVALLNKYNMLNFEKDSVEINMSKIAELIKFNTGKSPEEINENRRQNIEEEKDDAAITIRGSFKDCRNWKEKIVFILFFTKKQMSTAELISEIGNYQPMTESSAKSIALIASEMGIKGQIDVKKEGNKNYYYINLGN